MGNDRKSRMRRSGVSQHKEDLLRKKMARFGVEEGDLEEHFIRSSGPGGQHVNKVSSGVYLKHNPTGIEVKCTSQRSQALNRFLARRLLADKIESMILGKESREEKERQKIRAQKRRRSRRAKEKMLAQKKIRSEKKSLRKRPDIIEMA